MFTKTIRITRSGLSSCTPATVLFTPTVLTTVTSAPPTRMADTTQINTELPEEKLEYDVVIVGAGPAGLACAIRLKQRNPAISVCILEKAAQVGAHILSGAVIETEALDRLLPEWRNAPPSPCVEVTRNVMYFLDKHTAYRLPTLGMHGTFANQRIVSLGGLCIWLAEQAEALGVDIFPGFAAISLVYGHDQQVIGVRTGDFGVQKDSTPGPQYTQGIAVLAKVTVLAEGARGYLSTQAIQKHALSSQHQTYSLGIKELWQIPENIATPGLVAHTIGWPANPHTYAGGFLYHFDNNTIALGYVSALEYRDPLYDPWQAFQSWKEHPSIKHLLDNSSLLGAGARVISTGGWQSLPCVEIKGAVLIGDSAGLLNVAKIKGTHQALSSGMLAAEHFVQNNLQTQGFNTKLRTSPIAHELKQVRNIKPGFQKNLWVGLINAAWETLTRGISPWTLSHGPSAAYIHKITEIPANKANKPSPLDGVQKTLPPSDRQHFVYYTSTSHNENQPIHLKLVDPDICMSRCLEEYGAPCQRFCPAQVYEIVQDPTTVLGKRLHINAANCIHCKACDIKDPYTVITWTPPEGGSGPKYSKM